MASKNKPVTQYTGTGTGATPSGTSTPSFGESGNATPQPGVDALGDVADKIVPGQPKLPGANKMAAAKEALTALDLLTMYKDFFSPNGAPTTKDMKNLRILDNPQLADYLKNKSGGQALVEGPERTKAQAEMAKIITQHVPGLTASEIIGYDPEKIMGLPISAAVSKTFDKGGFAIPEGTPIGTAIHTIDPTKLVGEKDLTAAEYYDSGLQSFYAAKPGEQKKLIQTLLDGRYLDTATPSRTQLESGYAKLVRDSVTTNVSPQDILETSPTSSVQSAEISDAADRLGVSLTEADKVQLVQQATQGAWQTPQISQAVAGYFKFDPANLSGTAASLYQGMQKIVDEYQIPMSAAGYGQWVSNAIKGIDFANPAPDAAAYSTGTSAAQAAFTQYAQKTAMGLYPQFASEIAQGVSTQSLLDPYEQVAASVLGFGSTSGAGNSVSMVDANAGKAGLGINWQDPKWRAVLQGGTPDPTTGKPTGMTLDQARKYFITNPAFGWDKTDDAKNAGFAVADHLLSVFGQPAGQGQ